MNLRVTTTVSKTLSAKPIVFMAKFDDARGISNQGASLNNYDTPPPLGSGAVKISGYCTPRGYQKLALKNL